MFRITHEGDYQRGKVTKLYKYTGSGTIEIESAIAGDIAGIAGMDDLDIGETMVATEAQEALPFVAIDPPTLSMQFVVNDTACNAKAGPTSVFKSATLIVATCSPCKRAVSCRSRWSLRPCAAKASRCACRAPR